MIGNYRAAFLQPLGDRRRQNVEQQPLRLLLLELQLGLGFARRLAVHERHDRQDRERGHHVNREKHLTDRRVLVLVRQPVLHRVVVPQERTDADGEQPDGDHHRAKVHHERERHDHEQKILEPVAPAEVINRQELVAHHLPRADDDGCQHGAPAADQRDVEAPDRHAADVHQGQRAVPQRVEHEDPRKVEHQRHEVRQQHGVVHPLVVPSHRRRHARGEPEGSCREIDGGFNHGIHPANWPAKPSKGVQASDPTKNEAAVPVQIGRDGVSKESRCNC
jgi:hypothetical protein